MFLLFYYNMELLYQKIYNLAILFTLENIYILKNSVYITLNQFCKKKYVKQYKHNIYMIFIHSHAYNYHKIQISYYKNSKDQLSMIHF